MPRDAAASGTAPARIFIDCTYTVATRGDRGIARAVRNLVRHAATDGRALPVVFDGRTFRLTTETERSILSGPNPPCQVRRGPIATVAVGGAAELLRAVAAMLPGALGRRLLGHTVYDRRLRLRSLPGRGALAAYGANACDGAPVPFVPGDLLLFADASWNVPYHAVLGGLRARGVRVALFCHDLLPLTHRHLCADPLDVFGRWLRAWLPQADVVLCNSETTRRELSRVVDRGHATLASGCRVEVCALGSDLVVDRDLPEPVLSVADGEPYYLTVGAIEPRKNHRTLLSALQRYWQSGGAMRAVWVGRWTIDSAPLRRRVLRDADHGRRLLVLDGVDDAGLVALYHNARAALFPSLAEGFGLPLAEALFCGCPVIASDIDAHREICGDRALYFDPRDAESLAALLGRVERGEQPLIATPARAGRTWQQAVAAMLEAIRRDGDAR